MKEAVTKITKEIEDNKNHPYIKVIGEFLLGYIEKNPEAAKKILDNDKTIGKSLEAMKNEAQKKQHNGMAMLTDQEGFQIVLNYFGIESKVDISAISEAETSKKTSTDFDVQLEDLL